MFWLMKMERQLMKMERHRRQLKILIPFRCLLRQPFTILLNRKHFSSCLSRSTHPLKKLRPQLARVQRKSKRTRWKPISTPTNSWRNFNSVWKPVWKHLCLDLDSASIIRCGMIWWSVNCGIRWSLLSNSMRNISLNILMRKSQCRKLMHFHRILTPW